MCQLWTQWFLEITLFDTHSKLYKFDLIILFTEEETEDHTM